MAKHDLGQRLDAVASERADLEAKLEKQQAVLRKIDRQDPEAYQPQLAKVNALKSEIAAKATEHVELARAVALVSGGKNHTPPASA